MTACDEPDPHHAEVRRATRWLAVCVVLVTLGSLYPWHFAWPSSLSAAWSHMMNQRPWWTGTRDVVSNVVLFVPLGVLGWAVLRPSRWPMLLAVALVVGVGVAFAFALQVAQIFVPRRDPVCSDVVWNTSGLLVGVLLAKPMLRLPMACWRFTKCLSQPRGKAR
jgi:VanZ family protein